MSLDEVARFGRFLAIGIFAACGPGAQPATDRVPLTACDTVPDQVAHVAPRLPKLSEKAIRGTVIVGIVTDIQTGNALSGAVLRFRGPTNRDVRTDSLGGFLVERLVPGRYQVEVVRMGYRGVRDSLTAVAEGLDTAAFQLRYHVCR